MNIDKDKLHRTFSSKSDFEFLELFQNREEYTEEAQEIILKVLEIIRSVKFSLPSFSYQDILLSL